MAAKSNIAAIPNIPKQNPIAAINLISPPPTPPYFIAMNIRLAAGNKKPTILSNSGRYGVLKKKADTPPIRRIAIQVQSGMIRFFMSVIAAQIIGIAHSIIIIRSPL